MKLKPIPIEVGAKFENMALTLKRKPLVAFMLLELLEDGNADSKEWLRERVGKGMFTARYIRV